MGKKLLIFCALVILPAISYSQDYTESKHPIDVEMNQCMEKDGSTQGMIQCMSEAEEKWDAEMNKYYKLLISEIESDTVAVNDLRDAQREWIKYRDKEFRTIASYYTFVYNKMGGGTIYSLIAQGDHLDVVRARALEIIGKYDVLHEFE
jgi:uncharacterized protein YecT (DUF1311 family)